MNGHEKLGVKKLFFVQVLLSFVVIAVLIVAGGFLVFNVMGKEYTPFTVFGFIATVYFAFIIFQPGGTLFASRVELIREKVQVKKDEKTKAKVPIASPLLKTAPLGIAAAVVCTGIIAAIVYGADWKPSPVVTVLVSLLFVIPFALIVRRYIFDDLSGLAAAGPFSGKPVTSKCRYIWAYYILPTFVFQLIINMPLANRGFSQEALKDPFSLVPTAVMALDYAVTFMFICNFTFLGVSANTLSDMYLGKYTYAGKAKGINGFLYFVLMLLMGAALGILFGGITKVLGVEKVPFLVALAGKFLTVLLSVYLGCRLAVGWTGKRFNDAVAKKMAEMSKTGKK
jgi:hypothetical protein